MSKSKKMLQGEGWSFEPASDDSKKEIVSLPAAKQKPKIKIEKRPNGKVVTLVENIILSVGDMKKLCKKLKSVCGCGGTTHDDSIEIQGDSREKIIGELVKQGWKV